MKLTLKIFAFILAIGLCRCAVESTQQEYAIMLIKEVETFKKVNKRLPKDVTELGLTELMASPAFYIMDSDSTYMVWYGVSIGESNVFRSITNKWSVEG